MIKEKGIPIPASLGAHCRKLLQHMLMFDMNRRWACDDLLREIENSSKGDEKPNMQMQVHANQMERRHQEIPFQQVLNQTLAQAPPHVQNSPQGINLSIERSRSLEVLQNIHGNGLVERSKISPVKENRNISLNHVSEPHKRLLNFVKV